MAASGCFTWEISSPNRNQPCLLSLNSTVPGSSAAKTCPPRAACRGFVSATCQTPRRMEEDAPLEADFEPQRDLPVRPPGPARIPDQHLSYPAAHAGRPDPRRLYRRRLHPPGLPRLPPGFPADGALHPPARPGRRGADDDLGRARAVHPAWQRPHREVRRF